MPEPLSLQRTPRPEDASSFSLFDLGFRCFFFGATLAALLLMPAWLFVLQGGATTPYFSSVAWHAHEMIFGYTGAVIAGFLLTAVGNWTKSVVASPRALLLLSLLWLSGRLCPLVPGLPPIVVFACDLAFLPVLTFVLGRPLGASKNQRNYFLVLLLLVLEFANLLYHLEVWGAPVSSGAGRDLALRMVALLILVIGGRVFPMFTRNATGNQRIKNVPWLDRLSIGLVVLTTAAEGFSLPRSLVGGLWMLAGVSNIVRMFTWGTLSAKAPLLWVLHLGYFFVALSFVLEGCFQYGLVPQATALHCFTAGGVGLLTLGMMARVSLGHSGRMLVAPNSVAWAFVLLTAAALVRFLTPLLAPAFLSLSWTVSGILWTLAYLLFLLFGWPIWSKPRVD